MFSKSPSDEWTQVGFSWATVSNSFHVAQSKDEGEIASNWKQCPD